MDEQVNNDLNEKTSQNSIGNADEDPGDVVGSIESNAIQSDDADTTFSDVKNSSVNNEDPGEVVSSTDSNATQSEEADTTSSDVKNSSVNKEDPGEEVASVGSDNEHAIHGDKAGTISSDVKNPSDDSDKEGAGVSEDSTDSGKESSGKSEDRTDSNNEHIIYHDAQKDQEPMYSGASTAATLGDSQEKRPWIKLKMKNLKHKKQNTTLLAKNHPVVEIFTWCVNDLIANARFTGGHQILVSSGHFKTYAKLNLRRQPFNQSKNHVPTKFKVRLYTPGVFTLLRRKFHVSEECFRTSLGCDAEINFDKNKGFMSPDGLFRVSVISDHEKKHFRKILKDYYAHIIKNDGETLLPNFVSLLSVSYQRESYNLLVTKSTILPEHKATRVFPIKGSVLRGDHGKIAGSDPELQATEIRLSFDGLEEDKIRKTISRDVQFLRNCGAIHYHLFIGKYRPEDLEKEQLDMLDNHPEGNLPTFNGEEDEGSIVEVDITVKGKETSEDVFSCGPEDERRDGPTRNLKTTPLKYTERLVNDGKPDNLQSDNVDDTMQQNTASNMNEQELNTVRNTKRAYSGALQYHKKNLKCNHDFQVILGSVAGYPSGVLYSMEFRDILRPYTPKRRIERFCHSILLRRFARYVSTVPPDEYSERLLKLIDQVLKQGHASQERCDERLK